MNEIHDLREAMASAIKAAVSSDCGVTLDPRGYQSGRVVVVELPDQIGTWENLGGSACWIMKPSIPVAVIITPPWDSEGGRRLMNDVVGAMSAVAQLNCTLTPALRGTIDVSDGATLPCYRFTAEFLQHVEG